MGGAFFLSGAALPSVALSRGQHFRYSVELADAPLGRAAYSSLLARFEIRP
jgi:hypothetical protein